MNLNDYEYCMATMCHKPHKSINYLRHHHKDDRYEMDPEFFVKLTDRERTMMHNWLRALGIDFYGLVGMTISQYANDGVYTVTYRAAVRQGDGSIMVNDNVTVSTENTVTTDEETNPLPYFILI